MSVTCNHFQIGIQISENLSEHSRDTKQKGFIETIKRILNSSKYSSKNA